jgi:mRNA interferase RelE/StbE
MIDSAIWAGRFSYTFEDNVDKKADSNHFPEYRMRAGDYRALFEVAGDQVIIYRILHRKESYR